MKFFIAVCFALAAYVCAENCMSADECTLTMCDANATLICERQECTCLQQATTGTTGDRVCTSKSDCDGLPHCHGDATHGHGGSHGHEWHCLDGVCRCAGFHP